MMFESEEALENALCDPTPEVIAAMGRMKGDLIVLGAAGKMGLSLSRMARRASDAAGVSRRILAVSRFRSVNDQGAFHRVGIETHPCDLLDEGQVERLPAFENVLYMAGMKFGSTGNEPMTWAMNAYLPSIVCRRFRGSRIVAFSTGNVYGLTDLSFGGSRETDPPAPVGEYAMSCLGRERLLEYFSRHWNIPTALIRLNYACDLRYGVVVDLATRIQRGEPIDLSMGYFNTLWQGDANAWTLQAFDVASSPAVLVNVTGPEILGVRNVAQQLAERLKLPVHFVGQESHTALISNCTWARSRFGPLRMDAKTLVDEVADWTSAGRRNLGKPTHFESRDGVF
jgi:nucleoside-diphosphate-sugar epimerase